MAGADLAAIRAALSGLCTSFAADGYRMSVVGFHDDRLEVVVEAGEDACAECLVSKEVTAEMIRMTLPPGVAVGSIDLVYPLDAH